MQNVARFNMLKLLLPAFDLSLIITLILFTTAGQGELIDEDKSNNIQNEYSWCSQSDIEDEINRMKYKKEQLLNELENEKANLREGSDSPESADSERAAAREKVNKLRQENDIQKKQLELLMKQKSESVNRLADYENIKQENAKLAKEIEDIENRNKIFKKEIAEASVPPRQTINVESTPLINMKTERKRVYITIADGTVTPVCEPYYKISKEMLELGNGNFTQVEKASRHQNGETIDQAVKEGSAFLDFARQLRPDKEFVAMLVDSSSFETFRTIRKLLRKQGLAFGWHPTLSKSTLYFTSTGGVVVGEEIQ
jgi:NADH dehydrogenase/NADH:ubiquinone oxidoreductase subunit G